MAGLCPGRRVIDLPRRVGPRSGETAGWLGWLVGWVAVAAARKDLFEVVYARLSGYRPSRTLRGVMSQPFFSLSLSLVHLRSAENRSVLLNTLVECRRCVHVTAI